MAKVLLDILIYVSRKSRRRSHNCQPFCDVVHTVLLSSLKPQTPCYLGTASAALGAAAGAGAPTVQSTGAPRRCRENQSTEAA